MKQSENKKSYLTPGQVADMLMVTPAAVRNWAAHGEIKAMTTPGGHRRFLPQEVERFANERNMSMHSQKKKKTRVLIIDDDMQFSGYLNTLLERFTDEVEVKVVNDSFEAGITVVEFIPDIILLDLMMPGLDGFQVCERLQKTNETSKTRIIAMTGYPSPENKSRIIAAGAEACLAKPIDRKILLDIIGVGHNTKG